MQNLKGVDFNEDSDEDETYDPVKDDVNNDEQFFDCDQCSFKTKYPNNLDRHTYIHKKNKKRKESSLIDEPLKKKPKPPTMDEDFSSHECEINFTREGNLKRHIMNKNYK